MPFIPQEYKDVSNALRPFGVTCKFLDFNNLVGVTDTIAKTKMVMNIGELKEYLQELKSTQI